MLDELFAAASQEEPKWKFLEFGKRARHFYFGDEVVFSGVMA